MKWFCAFNVARQPRGLENVLCSDFEGLVGLAVLSLILGCLVDGTAFGEALLRALNRVTSAIQSNHEILIRAVCGFFFVTLWSLEDNRNANSDDAISTTTPMTAYLATWEYTSCKSDCK